MSDENSVDSLALHYRDYEDGRSDKEYEGILDEDAEELRYEWQDDQDEILDDVDKEGSKKTDVKETERKEGHVYDAWEHGTTVIGDIDSAPDDFEEQKDQAARFSTSLGIPGVVRINLSALSQKIMGCVIDENVTTEYPWIYVRKEIIEDNIDLYPETSDFLPIKDQIEQYPGNKILVGYAPTTDDDEQGQFYVCVTLDGYNQMVKHIEDLRLEQQDRVRSAVYKTPGTWQDLGSGPIIDQNIVKPTRPDYVIEVETTVNQLKAPINLTDRPSDNQRDGYVALLPDRETFANVTRSLVDKSSNATSVIKEREAQTEIPMKTNFSNQCELDHKPSDNPPEGIVKAVNTFLKSKTDQVCKQIETNATWDVYANDYANLAGDDVNDTATGSTKYLERQCYYNGKLCSERVINDLAWHPQWTGIAATAYTTASKSENLVGRQPLNEAITEGNQVLIWSFDDCLKPKLILESKRQVTAVSFCPRNGNIVIGGCTNGQIVVWDITGKIEEVERIVVQNAAESRHETALKCLWTWMKESRECSVVRGTATSSLQFSQKGPITKIEWLSPYDKLNDRGILQDLPANTNEEDLSLQFIASSEDGTIAFWDLNWRPSEEKSVKIRSKKRKPVEKPNSLARSISRYKILDGVFKPLYILIVQNENEPRNAIITSMSVARPPNHKKLLDEDQHSENLAARRRYEVTIKKRETPLAGIFIGTARGECGLVSWEGFEFSTGITLNKEVCKWTWRKQVHDGPVSHAVRSRFLKDVILTVGGRIFAIWREDFPESLFWRKSENRYTACCWDNSSPSKIILGHNEGTVEVWDLSIKCHEPNTTQSLSGRVITGIHAHELPLYPPCVGFCDFNGALRIFIAPKNSSKFRQIDVDWMRQFVDREVNRIKDFVAWTNERKEMNKKMQEEKEAEAAKLELIQADEMKKKKITQEVGQMIATKIAKARSRKKLVDEMRARWVTRELDRMQRGILEKKGLHEEELERRYEPVKKMKEEAREKEERRRRAFGQADELFEEAVASNFPHQKEKLLSEFTLSSFGQDRPADLASIDATIPLGDDETVEDEVLKEYKIIEAQALSTMHRRSYDVDFSWRELIKAGIKRRKCLDVKLKIHKAHINHEDSSSGENSLLSDTVASSNISIRNPSVELERADSS